MAQITGQQPFTALPSWIFEKQLSDPGWLSCQELSILMAIQYWTSKFSEQVFPSYKTISMIAGVSRKTAIKCVKSLEHKNLLVKHERFRMHDNARMSNSYSLVFRQPL
jgi:hypothetical protein